MAKDRDPTESEEAAPRHNHLISRKMVREFIASHPEAKRDEAILLGWCKTVETADWRTFADIVATVNDAQQVGKFVVSNVGGHKYRFVYGVQFRDGNAATVYLRWVVTHKEYDKLTLK